MWKVLYSDENVPMIIMDFDTLQFKVIQNFDNTINKKRKRNHDDDNNNDDSNTNKITINQKSDTIISYNDVNDTEDDSYNDVNDTEDDDIDVKDDDTIEQYTTRSTSTSSTKKCNHYIKNHILASHEQDEKKREAVEYMREAAREYMRNKKLNKKRGALPKWVKKFA